MDAHPLHEGGDEAVMRDLRHQARSTRPLGEAEVETLLEMSAGGDRGSQERLVAANLGMVIRLAEEREDKGLPVPDLVQEGSLGLLEAVRTFPGGGHGEFASFARKKAGEQMDAAIAAEAAAVREAEQLVAAANDYERTEVLLRRVLQRPPTEAEIAEKLEWNVERTRYVAEVVADARRRHDEELLAFIDPDAIDGGELDGDDTVDE
jgi:DNA-directed RNA polymerase sigma subunit (sigma70/sigma32)